MNITLSEVSQWKINTVCYHIHVKSKKYRHECTCKLETDLRNIKQACGCQRREGMGEGQIFSMRITNYSVWNRKATRICHILIYRELQPLSYNKS